MRVSIIGAGAWGTTLALLLAEKGQTVTLWVYEKELAGQIQEFRENKTFLPGVQLPESIEAVHSEEQTKNADIFFFSIPTQFLRSTAQRFKNIIRPGSSVVSAGKGIEINSLKLPLAILADELKTTSLAALSGPNLSAEIAKGLPAASVVASATTEVAKTVQTALMLERFRVYINADPLGVQLGGALKNVIAIAAGIADGLELGNNAKAGLMIRGIAEITRLGAAMGADPKTFSGLSGMGDLITTCGSKLSRNHCVGEQLARGKKLSEILAGMKDVAEGVPTAKAALALGRKYQVELPVTKEVCQVLYEGKKPFQSITDLMARSATNE
ncbi:MAG: NAD(P)-dependent glycerol-3-phosphate dehydrogenase [Candidatus Margulisbacteria bacterium]|nr:NAD(P)-dependent glycerol-3-phosphate dehydrogenase [Candidatus Margulisiibacteriota bacterium]